MKVISSLTSRGFVLDTSPQSFGALQSSADVINDAEQLRARFRDDGYLYVPGFFERSIIARVRSGFLHSLQDEKLLRLDSPMEGALHSGKTGSLSRKAIQENSALGEVVFSSRLTDFYTRLFGGEVRHYDHIWTRVIPPGRGTAPHCDLVYMGRGTHDVMTAWIPYGDVSLELGGLMLLEKSHTQANRLGNYLAKDVDEYCANRGGYKPNNGILSKNPVSLREKLGGRWLTAEFRMGDMLTFGMKMLHASLDNQTGAYRLSSDTRYQLAREPIDPRWVGPDTEEYAAKNRIGKIC